MKFILDWGMWLAEWVIVIILLDDIYGLTAIKKHSKRKWRKYWRKFFSDSRKYHKKTRGGDTK